MPENKRKKRETRARKQMMAICANPQENSLLDQYFWALKVLTNTIENDSADQLAARKVMRFIHSKKIKEYPYEETRK